MKNTNLKEDLYHGDAEIFESEEERCLGDIISKNAKNVKNIEAR